MGSSADFPHAVHAQLEAEQPPHRQLFFAEEVWEGSEFLVAFLCVTKWLLSCIAGFVPRHQP